MSRFVKAYRGHQTPLVLTLAAIALVLLTLASESRCESRLVSQEQAAQLGLTRAWFTQVRLNSGFTRVERAVLEGDRLTILTNSGVVQELDARTGKTLWVAPIGNENYPSLGPAGNEKYVAILNGATLYVLDRTNGKPAFIRTVGGAPGAAPALSDDYVFVPLISGRIEAFSLKNQKLAPWYYQSYGRAMVAPLITPESIVWTTDAGYLYVGGSNKLGMRFRLETGAEIVASPSYHHPYVYVASLDGELFAMHEVSGSQRWKYSCGFPVVRTPAEVGDRVFITSGEPALHCIDGNSGAGLWETPNIAQFAAASKDRVYAVTDLGALVALNAKTGAALARVTTARPVRALVNDQTDRVYLVSDEGMVECLHELGSKEPLYHNPKPVAPKEEAKPGETPAAPPAKATEKPATAPAKKASDSSEQPKADAGKAPEKEKKNDAATEENPFG